MCQDFLKLVMAATVSNYVSQAQLEYIITKRYVKILLVQ